MYHIQVVTTAIVEWRGADIHIRAVPFKYYRCIDCNATRCVSHEVGTANLLLQHLHERHRLAVEAHMPKSVFDGLRRFAAAESDYANVV